MGLGGALTAAVSGLSSQAAALGAISDNVANSQTVGYKRVETEFSTLLTVSNAQVHNPGGVQSRPSRTLDVQGAVQTTSTVTNLAVSGDGYFAVSRVNGTSSSGLPSFESDPLYTRAGDFQVDANGYMVNTGGYYLNGWGINQQTGVVQNQALTPIRVNQLKDNPQATAKITYSANLPVSPSATLDQNSVTAGIQFQTGKVRFYDSLGAPHDLDVDWTKDTTRNDHWILTLSSSEPGVNITSTAGGSSVATGAGGGTGMKIDMYFAVADNTDNTGADTTAAATPYNVQAGSLINLGTSAAAAGTVNTPAQLPITINYTSTTASTQPLTLDFGRIGQAEQLTQFTGSDINIISSVQDGLPPGSFRNLEIDDHGFVTINYDNGARKTVYQVPVTQFSDYNSLQPENGNAYSATTLSGIPTYTQPGGNGTGTLVASALESSNVDIATEFTKMIQTQRAYGANSRVITVTSQLMDDTNNLIR